MYMCALYAYAAFCLFRTHKFEILVADDRGKQFKGIILKYTEYVQSKRTNEKEERKQMPSHAFILTEKDREEREGKPKTRNLTTIFIVIELCLLLYLNAFGGVVWQWEMFSTNIFDIFMCSLACLLACSSYARRCRVLIYVYACVYVMHLCSVGN